MLERIVTALVLVAVVLGCMFATQSHYPMLVLMIVAAGVAGYEWYKLMPREVGAVVKPKLGVMVYLLPLFLVLPYSFMTLLYCYGLLQF